MIDEAQLTKLYYSIGEVADMLTVNASLIRFWEKEFPQINPKKNKKGNRLFTPKDIVLLSTVYQLVKVEGHTLEGAKKALKQKKSNGVDSSNTTITDVSHVISKLEQIKSKLLALKR